MPRIPSIIDRPDVDEATYLLAAVQAPALADHAARMQRQTDEFAAAEKKERERYEEARQRQSQEYENRVQEQNAKIAAAMQEYTKSKRDHEKGRRATLIAGLVGLVIAALAFFLDNDSYGKTWSIFVMMIVGLPGIFFIVAGILYRGPVAPATPAPIEAPPPLDPLAPLTPPPPIPLPALPALAKAYWQVTVVPFDGDRSLIVNSQIAQPTDVELPEIDLTVVNTTVADDRDLTEPEALRSLHRLGQALTVRPHSQSLYLLPRDAPLGPVIEELLSTTPPDGANLDAPILPGVAEAGVEQMRQAVARLVAFAEQPFGINPEAARKLLSDANDWCEHTAASALERLLAKTMAPAPTKPAVPTAPRPADTPAQALERVFERVVTDLHADVDSRVAGLEAQAEERRGAATRGFEADRRKAEEDQQAMVRRLDDQAADLTRQRQAAESEKQQAEARLKQATRERGILEGKIKEARAAYDAAIVESTRLEKERSKTDANLQALNKTTDSLRAQVQAAQPGLERASTELTQLQQQLADLQAAQIRKRTDEATARGAVEAKKRNFDRVNGVTGIPAIVASQARQELDAATAAATVDRQAVQAGVAEISAAQARIAKLQQEIAAGAASAAQLAKKEQEGRNTADAAGQLARQLEEQARTVETCKAEATRLEHDASLAKELGAVETLQGEMAQHQHRISELTAALESVVGTKQRGQEQAAKRLTELQQVRDAALADANAWLAEQRTVITGHIARLIGQRDSLLKEIPGSVDDLPAGQLDLALLTYRRQALEERRELVQHAISALGGQLDTIQEQIEAHLWAIRPPSGAEADCLIPIWFSKPNEKAAWDVLAAGRTFLAQPVTRDQRVNAALTVTANPLISYLRSSQIAARHAGLLEQRLQSSNPVALAEQARALESARLIDGEMRAYLEQAR